MKNYSEHFDGQEIAIHKETHITASITLRSFSKRNFFVLGKVRRAKTKRKEKIQQIAIKLYEGLNEK